MEILMSIHYSPLMMAYLYHITPVLYYCTLVLLERMHQVFIKIYTFYSHVYVGNIIERLSLLKVHIKNMFV